MRIVDGNITALRALLARQIPKTNGRNYGFLHAGETPTPTLPRSTGGGGKESRRCFHTGLTAVDEIAPGGGFRCGAIHELLFPPPQPSPGVPGEGEKRVPGEGERPKSFALLLARAAQSATSGVIVWSDPRREVYPVAVSAAGIDLRRLILLRPRNAANELSALNECLRCRGASATVANLNRLSDIEARRLQLAAERGGGVGIFLRPMLKDAAGNYAAATRWLVRCALGEANRQRWIIELLHGHGGRLGSTVLLEVDRETGEWRASPPSVRASAELADRPAVTPQARATA